MSERGCVDDGKVVRRALGGRWYVPLRIIPWFKEVYSLWYINLSATNQAQIFPPSMMKSNNITVAKSLS